MTRELMFLHRLALAMGRSVSELRRTLTWRELADWIKFDALHPLPDRLADLHHGILMAALVNITRAPEGTPAVPADFFVLRERHVEPEVEDPQLSEADRLAVVWRGGG